MKYLWLLLLFIGTPAAAADDAAVARGKALAEVNCAGCHAIEATGASPLAAAPRFPDIAVSFDLADLEDSLNEGVAADHTIMPDWQMTSEQAHALASYIISLAPAGKLKSEAAPGAQPDLAAAP